MVTSDPSQTLLTFLSKTQIEFVLMAINVYILTKFCSLICPDSYNVCRAAEDLVHSPHNAGND